MRTLPSLGFVEAIKLASSRILDFKGRSRRSEFWWWILVVLVVGNIITMFFPNLMVSGIIAIIYMFFGLSATARRLHDSGKSAIWVYISYALGCIVQIYTATSTTINKLVEELSYGSSISQHTIEKIMENGAGDLLTLSCLATIASIFHIIVIIMCLFDSTPATNKYGDSPKYVLDSPQQTAEEQ
jgi:uncharacterized membrane protein YhaH (DUF805 family)